VLLAAYELRRQTADIDFAALSTSNDVTEVRELVIEIASTPLPDHLDDGLIIDTRSVTAEAIRDEDQYAGVRVKLTASPATAREAFDVDVNVGDPIWPAPADIALPRLIDAEPIRLRGYPMEMVLAEKIVTALERGIAGTRWRDFGDIYLLTGRNAYNARQVREALVAVSGYRRVELVGLDAVLDGYEAVGQSRWFNWRSKHGLADTLPAPFGIVLEAVAAFADPVLLDTVAGTATWQPVRRSW